MLLRYEVGKINAVQCKKKSVCPDGNTAVTNTLFGLYAQYSIDSNLVIHIITTVLDHEVKKYKNILPRYIITILVITYHLYAGYVPLCT